MKGRIVCPRCGTSFEPDSLVIEGDDAVTTCPSCGAELFFSLQEPHRSLPQEPGAEEEPFSDAPELRARWDEIRSLPLDAPEHDAFLDLCFKEGKLHHLAGAYRTLAERDPDGVARRLRQISILVTMSVPRTEEKVRRSSALGKAIFYVLLLLFLLLFLWIMAYSPLSGG